MNAIRKIFIEYPMKYIEYKKELVLVEQERQDLLHVLELGKLNAVEMSKIMRELKEVQQKRRRIKNNLEVLKVISDFANNFNNNRHKDKQIDTLINTVNNIVDRERKYTMRIRTDLQKVIDNA